MSDLALHALAPPWNLPGTRDETLLHYLRDEAWDDAVTLLRDVVRDDAKPTWLVLLAYARFRDANDVMFEQRLAASQEAHALLQKAMADGAPFEAVAPLLHEVETVLDEETRAEVAALAVLPADGSVPETVETEALADAAFRLCSSAPARAAQLFEVLARRLETTHAGAARVMRLHAGVCWADSGDWTRAKPLLDDALTVPWKDAPFRDERALGELAVTHLLRHATGDDFEATWQVADAQGRLSGLTFPSVRPNQEALLRRAIELRDWPKARFVATRIEETREQIPEALAVLMAHVRQQRA
ncbi:MAG: hypothetical protein JNG84_03890 [Archangium sp.]|nr:hypothetical protein [Archangium sp.]